MALDETGLTIPTVEELLADIEGDQIATIDSTLIVEADELLGQINGVFASKLREVWEALLVAFNAFNPDASEGFLLEALASITGTIKRVATFGSVVLECNLDEDTELVANVHSANVVGNTANRWVIQSTFIAPSDGTYSLTFIASEPGAVQANAGTISEIATPVTGWNTVTNNTDANAGQDEETDLALRGRREVELAQSGSSTVASIRAAVSSVTGVQSVTVNENDTNTTDLNGLPPHSIEVLVFDGVGVDADNDDIAQSIFDNRSAGIQTFGSLSGNAVDSASNTVVQSFNRPDIVPLYVLADYELLPGATVTQAAVETAIVNHLQSINAVGGDCYIAEIAFAILSIDGVRNVPLTSIKVDASPAPTLNQDYAIALREIADYDTGRITATEV